MKWHSYLIFFVFILLNSAAAAQNNANASEEVQLLLDQSKNALTTNPVQAISFAREAYKEGQKNGDKESSALAFKYLGTAYFYLGQYDSTKHYWNQSTRILKPIGGALLADSYNNLGIIYQRVGPIDSSYYHHSMALQLRMTIFDTIGVANSYFNLGALQRTFGKFEMALDYNFQALRIYELLGEQDKIGESYNSIALVYLSIKDYEQALSYLQKALDIKLQSGSARSLGNTLNNIASTYELLKDLDNAETHYLKAKEIFEKLNDKRVLAGISSNLGIIYKNRLEYDKAIDFYQEAATNFEEVGDAEGSTMAYNNLGAVYYLKKNYLLSKDAFSKAVESAKECASLPLEMNAVQGLSNVYVKLGDYKLAFENNLKQVELNDSLFSQSTAEKIAELQESYEAEKKIRKIKELENISLAKEKSLQQKQFFIWLISSVGILSIGLLLLALNRIKLKRKILHAEKERYRLNTELQQKELDLKNRELTAYASSSLQKGKFLQDVLEKLEKLQLESNNAILQTEEVKRSIKSTLNDQEDWDKFKLHFENVHPNFFDSLKKSFDSLTVNDLKHCAYIRMNLSSKEVAVLMNISPKSAKMNRYRLKKKLQLVEEESIQDFLVNF